MTYNAGQNILEQGKIFAFSNETAASQQRNIVWMLSEVKEGGENVKMRRSEIFSKNITFSKYLPSIALSLLVMIGTVDALFWGFTSEK